MTSRIKIRRALISVSDKTGLLPFAEKLHKAGVQILSTGGTAKALREKGIAVTEISDHTGFPEMLDGRVKTLHPKVHAGILARRDVPVHLETLEQHAIPMIDLVCVNLYPFRETVAKEGVLLEDAIENIDIGGPAMLRSAAKNYEGVAVVVNPSDYEGILAEMQQNEMSLSLNTRFALAKKAFVHTARYDGAIANWLTSLDTDEGVAKDAAPKRAAFSTHWQQGFDLVENLRYGENPHQEAAFYRDPERLSGSISDYQQMQGKALSYNNIADADAAWECVKSFDTPSCVIVKHANPCGVAMADSLTAAYEKAFETDSVSAFGGIIAFNGTVDEHLVQAMNARKHFVEVLIAPDFTEAAESLLSQKSNLRVLRLPLQRGFHAFEMKRVGGGLLLQTPDTFRVEATDLKVVSKKTPTPEQIADLLFAFRVVKFVKSNAIVFCKEGMTLGIGAGQMSRVDATRIATIKAKEAGRSLKGAVVASDAFFPFRDGVDVLAEAGAAAVIQPGGSIRDEEVIAAADELGLVMVFTGVRHFRH